MGERNPEEMTEVERLREALEVALQWFGQEPIDREGRLDMEADQRRIVALVPDNGMLR